MHSFSFTREHKLCLGTTRRSTNRRDLSRVEYTQQSEQRTWSFVFKSSGLEWGALRQGGVGDECKENQYGEVLGNHLFGRPRRRQRNREIRSENGRPILPLNEDVPSGGSRYWRSKTSGSNLPQQAFTGQLRK